MYICSQVTSTRDGFPVVVYCLLTKAFRKEDCDQLTALNFKNILFCLESLPIFYFNFYSLFLYLLGNVTSVISLLLLLIGYLHGAFCGVIKKRLNL